MKRFAFRLDRVLGIRRFELERARIALAAADLWPTHPYGLPTTGTEDSVSQLDEADLAAWWRDHLAAELARAGNRSFDHVLVHGCLLTPLA